MILSARFLYIAVYILSELILQGLHVVQLLIIAVHGYKTFVGAMLHDASLMQDVYLICILYGGKTMGYGYGGARLHQLFKSILHKTLALGVES